MLLRCTWQQERERALFLSDRDRGWWASLRPQLGALGSVWEGHRVEERLRTAECTGLAGFRRCLYLPTPTL